MSQAASQGDMPTILETNREVNKDWNPIHESWLPSTMTTQYLQNEAKPPSGEVISRPESVAKPEPVRNLTVSQGLTMASSSEDD